MAVSLVPGALSRAISGSSTKPGVQRQGEAAAGGQAKEAVMGLRAGGAKVRPEVGAGFPGLARVG